MLPLTPEKQNPQSGHPIFFSKTLCSIRRTFCPKTASNAQIIPEGLVFLGELFIFSVPRRTRWLWGIMAASIPRDISLNPTNLAHQGSSPYPAMGDKSGGLLKIHFGPAFRPGDKYFRSVQGIQIDRKFRWFPHVGGVDVDASPLFDQAKSVPEGRQGWAEVTTQASTPRPWVILQISSSMSFLVGIKKPRRLPTQGPPPAVLGLYRK